MTTLAEIERAMGHSLDRRRFRPNIVVDSPANRDETAWIGRSLLFGEDESAAHVEVNYRTRRCMIVNLHPKSGDADSRILRTVATIRES